MDTNHGEKTTGNIPSYLHEKIGSVSSRDAQKDIEAGEKGVNIGENDLGLESNNSSTQVYVVSEEGSKRRSFGIYWKIGHVVIWLVMTGYASLLLLSPPLDRNQLTQRQLVDCRTCPSPLRSWMVDSLPCLARPYYSTGHALCLNHICYQANCIHLGQGCLQPVQMIPEKFRLPLGAAGTIAVFLVGTFIPEESADNTRANRAVSLFGLLVFIGAFYATSRDRKAIQWQTVIVGMLAQFLLALFVLRTQAGVSLLFSASSGDSLIDKPSMIFSTSSHTLPNLSSDLPRMEPHFF
jgi:CNT family concentrative nucleoside transporter